MKRILTVVLAFFLSNSMAFVYTAADIKTLKKNLLANITSEGSIMASPSKSHPDYYYDWTRDSAIAMGLIESWFEASQDPQDKKLMFNYVSWTERVQHQNETLPGYDILGEPKFYMDSRPFDGQWGRPQNDGPALRAMVLIRFANTLLSNNGADYVKKHLYAGGMDPNSMGAIKMDLEYTAHHWQDLNFDLWEEVYGHHFFTAMVQQDALIEGAKLARKMHDDAAAAYYQNQASQIQLRLLHHIDLHHNLIQATIPPHAGPQKDMELDTAVILAVLLTNNGGELFAPENSLIRNTAKALKAQFKSLFPINQNHNKAILFGRYPGDTYDGYQSNSKGNPWYLLTATMAEYNYTLGCRLAPTKENLPKIQKYMETGDNYLSLVKHYGPESNLSEQINLNTGKPQGANSLTWSYVAVLRAIAAHEKLMQGC